MYKAIVNFINLFISERASDGASRYRRNRLHHYMLLMQRCVLDNTLDFNTF